MKSYPDRIRFNWGFHDATGDKERGHNRQTIPQGNLFCLPLRDSVYCAGYAHGQAELLLCGRPESSTPAWICWQADKIAEKANAYANR